MRCSTADSREFRELSDDDAGASAWYFKPKGKLEAADPAAFEVLDFTVDGEPRKLRRSTKADSQTYSANLGSEAVRAGTPVTVAYTLRTVTALNGHRLRLRVDQPTKGLAIDFDYSDTELSEVAVLDYIASGERTRIRRTPPSVPDKVVTVEFDGWIFPRSGVAFVWS